MKISEIKNELLTTLSPCVLNHGFKVNKTKFCLKKNDENNESQFSFDYNSWGDEIHLFPYVQIKNKMIHSICEANGFHLNYTAFINLLLLRKIYDGTYTEDSKWQLQYDRQDRFIIFNKRDLENTEKEMINLVSFGLEYLETNNNVYAIDKMYNTPPLNKHNPNCSGFDTQCIIGLISAKLAHNENYGQICDYYSSSINSEDMLQDTRHKFESIKKFIETL